MRTLERDLKNFRRWMAFGDKSGDYSQSGAASSTLVVPTPKLVVPGGQGWYRAYLNAVLGGYSSTIYAMVQGISFMLDGVIAYQRTYYVYGPLNTNLYSLLDMSWVFQGKVSSSLLQIGLTNQANCSMLMTNSSSSYTQLSLDEIAPPSQ